MPRIKTQLLLFDIDGTLLLSGGAGKRALNRAFKESFGVNDGFDSYPSLVEQTNLFLEKRLRGLGRRRPIYIETSFFHFTINILSLIHI